MNFPLSGLPDGTVLTCLTCGGTFTDDSTALARHRANRHRENAMRVCYPVVLREAEQTVRQAIATLSHLPPAAPWASYQSLLRQVASGLVASFSQMEEREE